MKIYFLSSTPCALRLGGAYFGMVDTFERFADVSLKDNLFVEFCPENALPICFFLTDNIRFTPPTGCEVYLLRDGIVIYAKDFPPSDLTFRPIAQRREGNLLATVFAQGKIHLSLQTSDGVYTDLLPKEFASCELFFQQSLLFIKSPQTLAVYNLQGKRLLLENVLSYAVEEGFLTATLPLSDSKQRLADCRWALSPDGCRQTEFTLRQFTNHTAQETAEELLPYAFFESVLIGENYADFLCEELQPKANELAAFLGDFVAVALTDDPLTCCLLRQKGERLFEGAYYTVTIENNKITDVTT